LVNSVTATTGWSGAWLLQKFIELEFSPVIDTKGQETVFEMTDNGTIENVKVRRSDQHHILTVLTNLGSVQSAGKQLRDMGCEFPYPKPVPLIKYLISFAPPDGLILDYFAGSGTTGQAVMELNAADGGHRQCILVTNNELGEKAERALRKAGHKKGDPEWESEGIYQKVTRPRIKTVVTGVRDDGSKYSDGLSENVEFFDLSYEDVEAVRLDLAFEAVAPLLWLRAGGQGSCIQRPNHTFDVADHYGVLFNPDHWRVFVNALEKVEDLRCVYVVTDDDSVFQQVAMKLPNEMSGKRVDVVRLYESYLNNFEINSSCGV
jgi:adenine-specific DNA-methyltransferase